MSMFYTFMCLFVKNQNQAKSFSVVFELQYGSPKLSSQRSVCCSLFAKNNSIVGLRLKTENEICEALTYDWYEQMEFSTGFEYYIKKSVMNRTQVSFICSCFCSCMY